MTKPDLKPSPRVRNPDILRALHQRWRECALCGEHRRKLSLHHIHRHPRDDVEANLVMLCGDGTTGCHGLIEAGDRGTRGRLGLHILHDREDVLPYLSQKLGGEQAARAWVTRYLHVAA